MFFFDECYGLSALNDGRLICHFGNRDVSIQQQLSKVTIIGRAA